MKAIEFDLVDLLFSFFMHAISALNVNQAHYGRFRPCDTDHTSWISTTPGAKHCFTPGATKQPFAPSWHRISIHYRLNALPRIDTGTDGCLKKPVKR